MSTEQTRVTAALEALADDATPEQVAEAIHGYSKRDIAAAMFSITDGGGGGGSQPVLENPGAAWQPETAYDVDDRFAETIGGELRVFEITVAGTSGAGAFSDYGSDLIPLADWGTGSETFIYIGVVGQIPWTVAPFLGGGLSVGPWAASGHELSYTTKAAPEDGSDMFSLAATVNDEPVAVFEAATDGDADWFLDVNAGAGFRFSPAEDGVPVLFAASVEMTTDGFRVFTDVGGNKEFRVNYDPFFVRMTGLPTADPVAAGQLWNDAGTLKISAGV